jgi:crossover junction endodeoxyribonuclease RuvC
MYFVGIDQSMNHTGVCVLNGAGTLHAWSLIEPRTLRGYERLAFLRAGLQEVLKDLQFQVGVLEGYSFGSLNRKFDLGEVGAIIKLALFDVCSTVYVAAPKQLKKFVTARASAEKQEVMDAIAAQWGVPVQNDNLADAFGLAQIARQLHVWDTTQRHQLDVLHAIAGTKLSPQKPKMRRYSRGYKDAL